MTAARVPDCAAFGHIGTPHCSYCGAVSRTAREHLAAELRRLLRTTPQTPEPTGPVGTSTAATAGATTP